jgi:hypothetical protein
MEMVYPQFEYELGFISDTANWVLISVVLLLREESNGLPLVIFMVAQTTQQTPPALYRQNHIITLMMFL